MSWRYSLLLVSGVCYHCSWVWISFFRMTLGQVSELVLVLQAENEANDIRKLRRAFSGAPPPPIHCASIYCVSFLFSAKSQMIIFHQGDVTLKEVAECHADDFVAEAVQWWLSCNPSAGFHGAVVDIYCKCQPESEISEFRNCPNTDLVLGRTTAKFVGQLRTNTFT